MKYKKILNKNQRKKMMRCSNLEIVVIITDRNPLKYQQNFHCLQCLVFIATKSHPPFLVRYPILLPGNTMESGLIKF